MTKKLEDLFEIIKGSNNVAFFGGAGVSTASGIPDFRSSTGLFNENLNRTFTPEQLVSHSFFINYPKEFFQFYKEKLIYPEAKPNDCHFALARLEQMEKLQAIITQNIDGLHQMAGSKKVYELHGSVLRNYCSCCHTFYDINFIQESEGIPKCLKCNSVVKPDVVLYEEGLNQEVIIKSIRAIKNADTLIIGGTSLIVYPAAGLIDYFQGKNLILINRDKTPADHLADLVFHESIDQVLKEVVDNL